MATNLGGTPARFPEATRRTVLEYVFQMRSGHWWRTRHFERVAYAGTAGEAYTFGHHGAQVYLAVELVDSLTAEQVWEPVTPAGE